MRQPAKFSWLRSPVWRALALVIAATGVRAADAFVLFARPVALPEQGFVTGYVVGTDGYQFSFLPVRKWHLESRAAAKQVTFLAPDLSTSISFRILAKKADGPPAVGSGPLRQFIQEHYPQATVVGEIPCFTDGGEGLMFDLEQTVHKGLNTTIRLAFLPYPDGVVEFKLTTATQKSRRYKLALGNLMTSFRVESAGPASASGAGDRETPEIPPIRPKPPPDPPEH